MKILFIQLTRFGDILCTLPAIAAVRRKFPQAEIHFLVRTKFAQAAVLGKHVDKIWQWHSEAIIGPFANADKPRALRQTEALQALKGHIISLKRERFDVIYNLSFSPSSSFITHMVSSPETEVFGYTRTQDFFLHIPDERSRYFRAQVGTEKNNRLHVNDVFAWICGTELQEKDLRIATSGIRHGVVCHLGASVENKTWTPQSWYALLRKLTGQLKVPVTLVGSAQESDFANQLAMQVDEPQFLSNKVGQTQFSELIQIMAQAQLFIGADSGPLHAASLAGCRSLNLSVGPVRFWETGPTVPGSRILVRENPEHLTSEDVFVHAASMLANEPAREACVECIDMNGIRYRLLPKAGARSDDWEIVEWLYFDGPAPRIGEDLRVALAQVMDVCALAVDLVESLEKDPAKTEVVQVLDRIDDVLKLVEGSYAYLRPLLWAFVVERENNPPGSREEVFSYTKRVYQQLRGWSAELLSGEAESGKDL